MNDILDLMKEQLLEQRNDFKKALVKQLKSETKKTQFPPAVKHWAIRNASQQVMQKGISEIGAKAVNQLLYEDFEYQNRRR